MILSMKKYTLRLIVVIILSNSVNLFSQSLKFPYSGKPNIDGVIDSAEWSAADSVSITISVNRKTVVYFMRDSSNLNFAFAGNLISGGNYFPEILINTHNDSASTFQTDDWWFHVSATDCEFKGGYGDYSNCQLVRPNWIAEPNFQAGQVTDTVEISIPDSTLGITSSDTIGISFLLNNFQNIQNYPANSNHLNPSTWAKATFSNTITGIDEKREPEAREFKVYPNPTKGPLKLEIQGSVGLSVSLQVLSLSGKLLESRSLNVSNGYLYEDLDLSSYEKGVYFLVIDSGIDKSYRKVVKY